MDLLAQVQVLLITVEAAFEIIASQVPPRHAIKLVENTSKREARLLDFYSDILDHSFRCDNIAH